MPGPKTFPCGDVGQPPCPPTNASGTYTLDDMKAHGFASYQKGQSDLFKKYKDSQGHIGSL